MYVIKDLLDDAFKNSNITSRLKENMVFPLWPSIVGSKIASNTKPERLENGVLKVSVSGSAWLQQLTFMKSDILKSYRDFIGSDLIKDIRFYTGNSYKEKDTRSKPAIEQLAMDFNSYNVPDEFQFNRLELGEGDKLQIEEQVKDIKDEELKEQMKKIIEKDFKIKLWKKNKGWKPCPECSILIDPTHNKCDFCNISKAEKKKSKQHKKI